jgi:hypothetical protein
VTKLCAVTKLGDLTVPKQFSEKKIVLCPNPDEVTRIDGISTKCKAKLNLFARKFQSADQEQKKL